MYIFFIGSPISFKYIWTVVFNKLDHSLLLVFILDYQHCLSTLIVPFLLYEAQMTLLAPTNQPRIKCKKILLYNSFESILDEDVPYSIVVENVTVGETKDMFKVFATLLCFFF